ncbi:MAG: hypothetical protein QG622_3010 [Actinomycetota bacterium]|nr:hypothetical protein [Actinomycetota bacterium]
MPARCPWTSDGDPVGEDFDFDDPGEMRARLPRLAAIFLTDDEMDGETDG